MIVYSTVCSGTKKTSNIQLISLSQKNCTLSCIMKIKSRFVLKTVFYWTSKSAISFEKGVGFFRPETAKRGCFPSLGTSVVYILVGGRGAGDLANVWNSLISGMGRPIDMERKGCESIIHDIDCEHCVGSVDVRDADRMTSHDDVIKWKHFPRYWPFVRRIHRSRWIPRTKASDAELCGFLWSASE